MMSQGNTPLVPSPLKFSSYAGSWIDVMSIVEKIVDESRWVITSDGIEITTMDPSHVTLLKITWHRETFLTYPDLEKELIIGMDTKDSVKIFKRLNRDDKIDVTIHPGGMHIVSGNKSFELPLLPINGAKPPYPRIPAELENTIYFTDFISWLDDIRTVDRQVKITCEDNSLVFSAKEHSAKVRVETPLSAHGVAELELGFDTDYIYSLLKVFEKLNEKATLYMAREKPWKFQLEVPKMGTIELIEAPMVST